MREIHECDISQALTQMNRSGWERVFPRILVDSVIFVRSKLPVSARFLLVLVIGFIIELKGNEERLAAVRTRVRSAGNVVHLIIHYPFLGWLQVLAGGCLSF